MLIKIAWRNIWRNNRRSLVVLLSVVVGVIAILFMDGLNNSFVKQMLDNQISTSVTHIQIHKKGFTDNKVVESYIPDKSGVETVLDTASGINAYSKRVIAFGLLSSARSSSGVYIYGINPEDESRVTKVDDSMVEGSYLSESSGREIVIGKALAKKLSVGVGDKVVAMSNTLKGSIGSDVYRIAGLFETHSSEFDKSTIFIPVNNAQNLLQIENNYYEYAMLVDDYKHVDKVKHNIASSLSGEYEIQSYKDLLPLLIVQMDMMKESMMVINLIVSAALIFGIINAMLMAVFERIQEIGVLMSIGMKNRKIFSLFILESFLIGLIGTLAGLLFGIGLVAIVGSSGINLSMFAESLQSLGIGSTLYPTLSVETIITTLIMIPLISVLGAIYPAVKAIKLEPVYAIRYV